jgi:hypothetical protein
MSITVKGKNVDRFERDITVYPAGDRISVDVSRSGSNCDDKFIAVPLTKADALRLGEELVRLGTPPPRKTGPEQFRELKLGDHFTVANGEGRTLPGKRVKVNHRQYVVIGGEMLHEGAHLGDTDDLTVVPR